MEEAAEARVTWMLRESTEQREVQGGNGVGPVMEDGGRENHAPSSLTSATLREPWPSSPLIFIFVHSEDETVVSCCLNLISLIVSNARHF